MRVNVSAGIAPVRCKQSRVYSVVQRRMIPRRTAIAIAWVRSRAPSLSITCSSLWGWTHKFQERKWVGCGARLGWIDGNDLYLDSSASYQAATKAAQLDPLELSEQTLRRRLHDCGLLVTIDSGRQTLLVRRTLDGCSRHVLHLRADDLI